LGQTWVLAVHARKGQCASGSKLSVFSSDDINLEMDLSAHLSNRN
ncbi:12917_t:CDS:2, partial [Funneliformis caledonium]